MGGSERELGLGMVGGVWIGHLTYLGVMFCIEIVILNLTKYV